LKQIEKKKRVFKTITKEDDRLYAKNELICPELLDELHDTVEELNFLCRANTPVKDKGYRIDKKQKNQLCKTISSTLKEIFEL